MTDPARHSYLIARDEWLRARDEFKKRLGQIALQQTTVTKSYQDWQTEIENAFHAYQKVADKYLDALESYAVARPEMRGRFAYDLAQAAGSAQLVGADEVAHRHMNTLGEVVVENARIAHKDWVENQDKEHFASVLLAVQDAEVMGVDGHPGVTAISDEIFDLLEQGKVRRDIKPVPALRNAPKVPSKKKRRRPMRSIPSVSTTIPWPPR
jgi:hypothetical protein